MEENRANLQGITRANVINNSCLSFIYSSKIVSISPSLSQFLYLFLLPLSHFWPAFFKDKRNVKKTLKV